MGCFSLRSLLLAAIVISNCITWTASRHSYTHNVLGHRRRHRRNGAGLALPSDYVIPGGEGSEAGWGQWGPPSECSRPCGGGVINQTRICSMFGPDGQPNCSGGAIKYYSCNTQDCPDTATDFRAEQCASYNDKVFKGRTYNWVPYTNGPRPCELNCMPKGERFYYRQAPKVIDGTRCNDESFDVCVNGECQPVGCDMMLGSHAREDKCRECRGNGSNCDTIASVFDNQDLTQGYTDILLIPEGATNIVIEEIEKSNNYLALRSLEDNKYYLNGEYQISFPHSLQIAGALWHYERSVQGFAAPDKLRCLGPITEPLYLSLLTQEPNVGIRYEYSIRKGLMPQTNAQYTWAQSDFTPCSVTCGTGFRARNVTCHRREPFEEVEENLCDAALRPLANETCQLAECLPEWVPSPWSPCSKLCGEGSQSRTVQCQKIISNGYPSIVDENQCFIRLGDKPAEHQKCNTSGNCPTWFTGPWKPCDKLCGDGKQTRQVVCHRKTDGRVEVLVDESCEDDKPAAEQPCNIHPCDGIDWVVSNWTGCDSCLSKNYTREALCVTKDQQVVDKELCAYHSMPELEKPCDEKELPACQSQWYGSQWSKCSVDCGVGVKTRKVFCGTFLEEQVEIVDDSKCDPATRYNDTTPCEVPDEECPAKWFTANWSECTKECDGGLQFRKVMCLSGGNASNACPESTIPDGEQPCNPEPCNIDELLSVSSTTVMDDDDLPECEEEEDEVGAELLSSTSLSDMMVSDASSTPEGSGSSETEFDFSFSTVSGSDFTETGSGETELTSTTESSYTESETSSKAMKETGSTEAGESSTTGPTDITTGSGETTVSGKTTVTGDVSGASSGFTESITGSSGSGETTPSTASGETKPSGATEKSTSIRSTGTTPGGSPGDTTSSDASGVTTPSGVSGETTPSGASKETTPSGASGETTPTGASGETTPRGATGETTPTGATGETTPTGASGETTPTSATGETTPTGATGETTPTGATGETTLSAASGETTTAGSPASTDADTSTTSESSPTSDETTKPSSTTSDSTTSSELTGTTASGETTTASSADTGSTTDSTGSTLKSKDSSKLGEAPPTPPPTTTGDAGTTASVNGSTPTGKSSGSTIEGTDSSSGSTATGGISGTTSSKDVSSGSTLPTTEPSSSNTGGSGPTTEAGTGPTGTGSDASTPTGSSSGSEKTTESGGTTASSSGSSPTGIFTGSTTTEGATTSSLGDITGSTSSKGVSSGSTLPTTELSSSNTGGSGPTTDAGTGPTGTGSDGSTPTGSSSGSETTTESGEGISTTDEGTTGSDETTPWDISTILSTNKPRCRPRNRPAKCKKSKFGCCPDKKTAAGGPFDEGCPNPTTCKDTKYGCCPDGVSPAGGPHNEDCPLPNCKETLYGCCKSDNKTPAVGNDQEGCPPPCKSSKYGCCADNDTQATGPHKAGCPETSTTTTESTDWDYTTETGSTETDSTETTTEGSTEATTAGVCSIVNGTEVCESCSEFEHGCCEDGTTPAHGPNHLGCCLLSPHGCCPDNYQAASGPDQEGCECKSSPFGCCPDNVSYARGANFSGCGCENTPHGCCPDRHTEATGPNFEGCSCHTYQFGCCPDGETIAKGPNNQGCLCRDTQHGCCSDGVTAAAGPDQQGCDCASSQFGCCLDGVTKSQSRNFTGCADAPINRQAACALPYDAGPCNNYTVQWYYDMQYGGCSRFHYGGCEGNGNRFADKAECEDVCVRPAAKDACNLPKVKGSCGNSLNHWYYDSNYRGCVPFSYGGCLGNANNFESRELCEKQCAPKINQEEKCQQAIERGSCAGNFSRWGYDEASGECQEFVWGGCEGNSNRFTSKAACMLQCNPPGEKRPECQLAQDAGNCTEMIPYWSFDGRKERCVPIYYSGCGGNGNRFRSQEQCEAACPKSFEKDKCTLPASSGECRNYREHWFYDTQNKQCRMFPYGGCGGNANNFLSEEQCKAECAATPPPAPATPLPQPTDICSLPPQTGPCRAAMPRWFYDAAAGRCDRFVYGGCQGNDNNFQSAQECEQRCSPSTSRPPIAPECRTSDLSECVGVGRVWYLEPSSGRCAAYEPARGAARCEVTGIFPSPEACERTCGDFKDLGDVCRFNVDPGACNERQLKYYYDAATQTCQPFTYGGCSGSPNRFSSVTECESICMPDPCRMPRAPGNCTDRIESWSYDEATDECSAFYYSGCNGNANRFQSQGECEGQCKTGAPPPPPTEPPIVEEQCRLPSSLEPCGASQIAFYYDYTQDRCLSAPIGSCDIPNRYSTEEECLRHCGEFRGQDVCHAPLNPGPCRNARQKYYWNLPVGRCEPFTYGGCEGGPNRFSNIDECEQVCGHLAIDRACALPPAPGAPCAGAGGGGGPRWHRSALYGDCRLFVYLGCEGNGNNFLTKQDCERHCSPPPPGYAPAENEVDCEPARRECAELHCEFGLTRTKDPSGGCDRCSCDPNPCADMKCGPGQRCHIVPYRASVSGDVKYTSQCRSDCSAERARCETLECEYTVQRTRGPDNCERCECVRPEPNCQPFADECRALKCSYGPITRTVDGDGCERCTCIAHPCEGKRCPEGQRCVVTASRDATSGEPQYSGDCGTVNKPGSCPAEQTPPGSCHVECNDDADCRGVQKCCRSGCSQLCRAPAPDQPPTVSLAPQAPRPDPATEREVASSEGGTATLRCLFHSNPPPQITWRKGEITIDGSQGRYKLTADGALQIVSLYRDDSGVYICVAQNELGSTQQEIVLRVDGPVNVPAGIVEESPSDVVGEIAQQLRIRCLAYGYPQPDIRWFHGTDMVPYDSAEFEARGNMLLIRSLRVDTLGEYTCQVYNGLGRAVSRTVVVRAERRAAGGPDSPHWLQRGAPPAPAPATERARTHASSQSIVEYPPVPKEFTVNVNTNIRATQTALATGGRLELSCDVDGHPEPKVYWTKDNQRLAESDRVYITPSRLSITQVAEEDAGEYGCNADNGYTSHRSTVQITVQKLFIPEQCKDNQYFATCTLIVRSNLCRHEYYSKFCCKTCVEAGALNPLELEFQADQSWTFKKK